VGQSVLTCADVPQVVGTASCTSQVWVDSTSLTVASETGLSASDVGALMSATLGVLVLAYAFRAVLGLFR